MTIDAILNKARPVEILLVEDNEGDILLAQMAFRAGKIDKRLTVAMDGFEALKIIRNQDEYAHHLCPDIILLDLNMPKKSGQEVLAEIKQDDKLKHIPVLILTSSKAESDVVKSYSLHANCYLVKPTNMKEFMDLVETIERFWFTMVTLPVAK